MNWSQWRADFERDGFLILPFKVEDPTLAMLRAEADCLLQDSEERGGARNALVRSRVFRDWAEEASLAATASALLGEGAAATKLTVFDKSPSANWKVPWHQDLTISLAERREVEGFGPWSVKHGIPHVQPPLVALQQTIALRVHLDSTPQENGALRVLAGSHRMGRLNQEQIAELRGRLPEVACAVLEGGIMAMSPLLVHASSPATSPSRRRVLHYEFSSFELPAGLAWA